MSERLIEAQGARTMAPADESVVTETELELLPAAARRYLRFMGVPGRSRDAWLRLAWQGRFRASLDRGWSRCTARQTNVSRPISRFFEMRLHVGLLPLTGRDSYSAGRGRLAIRLLDALTVKSATGPELDLGELVTWLDDAVLFAPSMLLRPEVVWSSHDPDAFELSLTDRGRTVGARVQLDERGAARDFSTKDRWYEDSVERRMHRARWSTPVDRWETIDGRPTPTRVRAIWHLPSALLTYAELALVPGSVSRGTTLTADARLGAGLKGDES